MVRHRGTCGFALYTAGQRYSFLLGLLLQDRYLHRQIQRLGIGHRPPLRPAGQPVSILPCLPQLLHRPVALVRYLPGPADDFDPQFGTIAKPLPQKFRSLSSSQNINSLTKIRLLHQPGVSRPPTKEHHSQDQQSPFLPREKRLARPEFARNRGQLQPEKMQRGPAPRSGDPTCRRGWSNRTGPARERSAARSR